MKISDILSKREYLYRQYFLNKGYTMSLPKYLTASPNNTLLQEVKAAYPLMDPASFSSEISREYFYKNLTFTNIKLIKDLITMLNDNVKLLPVNLTFITDYTFFYFLNSINNTGLTKNLELYKNQYRPMKKGITNMIRLHATGAIAMPSEVRLHILASSKDVIHS
jgi:hypothetical protein